MMIEINKIMNAYGNAEIQQVTGNSLKRIKIRTRTVIRGS